MLGGMWTRSHAGLGGPAPSSGIAIYTECSFLLLRGHARGRKNALTGMEYLLKVSEQ